MATEYKCSICHKWNSVLGGCGCNKLEIALLYLNQAHKFTLDYSTERAYVEDAIKLIEMYKNEQNI